jgi:hypothetical protein
MIESRFKPGQILCHFKRETLSPLEKVTNKYMYQVIGIGLHTETKESVLIYQGLYYPFDIFVRPLEMAEGKVDKEKYPDIKQEYRLEEYQEE